MTVRPVTENGLSYRYPVEIQSMANPRHPLAVRSEGQNVKVRLMVRIRMGGSLGGVGMHVDTTGYFLVS